MRSYTRTRLAALPRMPPGEGRTRFVSDLIARAGVELVEEILNAFEFDRNTGDVKGDDRLFPHDAAWREAYMGFVQEATALDPKDWVMLFARFDTCVHGSWGFDASYLTRAHLLEAVRGADYLDKWLEPLEGDDSQEVVDALLERLRWELDGGSSFHMGLLADALASRSVLAALPLLREALERKKGRALSGGDAMRVQRAIASLTSGIDPNVVGGMSVAEEPAAQGGLSVATAQSGDLSESASDTTGVVLDLEASAEDEEVDVGEEVEVG